MKYYIVVEVATGKQVPVVNYNRDRVWESMSFNLAARYCAEMNRAAHNPRAYRLQQTNEED